MCLALPGKVLSCSEGVAGMPYARVAFGTVVQEVCLVYVPEAQPGDYVVVHAGFALQRMDEAAAERTLALVRETR